MRYRGVIDRYADLLPVAPGDRIVTLHEGATPLLPAPRLGARLNLDLHLKLEGGNPTGSFKDRGMTLAVSKAVTAGCRAVVCASTGNTSASAAAYAARAGVPCYVVIPAGKIALGKLAQAVAHGAQVIEVAGNFDQGLDVVRRLAARHPEIALVNSVNPFRLEGQTTAAYEVCDDLGMAPDLLAIPVGNAGNISAYWRGFRRYRERGRIDRLPRLLGFQAAGAAPLVRGRPVERPETLATAIRIGNPASWELAVAAVRESGGRFAAVSDEEILAAYQMLAADEGVFCEPASAAPIAGLLRAAQAGELPPGATAVAVLTGHGLKDPERATADRPRIAAVEPTLAALEAAIGVEVTAGAPR